MDFAVINPANMESEGLVLCSYTDTLKINRTDKGISVKPRELAEFLHIKNDKEVFRDVPMDEQVPVENIIPRLNILCGSYKGERLDYVIRTMQLAAGLGG